MGSRWVVSNPSFPIFLLLYPSPRGISIIFQKVVNRHYKGKLNGKRSAAIEVGLSRCWTHAMTKLPWVMEIIAHDSWRHLGFHRERNLKAFEGVNKSEKHHLVWSKDTLISSWFGKGFVALLAACQMAFVVKLSRNLETIDTYVITKRFLDNTLTGSYNQKCHRIKWQSHPRKEESRILQFTR